MRLTLRILGGLLPPVLALTGCGQPADLWPAPEPVDSATVPQATQGSGDGLRVTAGARDWPEAAEIAEGVTPIWVSVENEGARPVALEYSNLAIVGAGGEAYHALPLYRVEGDAEGRATIRDISPVVRPGFDSREFWLAPHYSTIHPNSPVYQRPFYYDYGYYETYDADARGRPRPTAAMRAAALPEGVLDPGGKVEGWVFFERIPPAAESLYLRAGVEDARSGEDAAVVRLPLERPG